jgi:hypothetical protein
VDAVSCPNGRDPVRGDLGRACLRADVGSNDAEAAERSAGVFSAGEGSEFQNMGTQRCYS